MGLKDSLLFFTPNGIQYLTLEFDGNEKSSVKHYFRPALVKQLDLCDKEILAGEWTVLFAGLPQERLTFQVMEEMLPGSEEYYEGCGEAMQFPPELIRP